MAEPGKTKSILILVSLMLILDLPDILHHTKLTNDTFNILLLGETGVGKSTFINSFANYLQYETLKEASEGTPCCLIPLSFTVCDENYKNITVNFGDNDDENEVHITGQSATQQCKSFVFPYNGSRVRLIDTPGLCDTRGIKQDQDNVENILNCIGQLDYINCICILLKPDQARKTTDFDYCIKQLLSHINKQACRNIVFLFTNTKQTFYRPGQTAPIIDSLLKEIRELGADAVITFAKTTIYCVDNEAFRFLIARLNGINFGEPECMSFENSWKISRDECTRLMKYIMGDCDTPMLVPHITKNTLSINETKKNINLLFKPIVEITNVINDNLATIQLYKDDLLATETNVQGLRDKLVIPFSDIVTTKLRYPRVVCTSDTCKAKYVVHGVTKTHYTRHCHERCTCRLTGVQVDNVGDRHLKRCTVFSAMGGLIGTSKCKSCKCSFMKHMLVIFETKIIGKTQVDDERHNSLKSLNDKSKLKQEMLEAAEKKCKELRNEQATILQTQALFVDYLKNNAILPYNDAFKEYINLSIEKDSFAFKNNTNAIAIKELEQMKADYEKFQQVLQETKKVNINHVITEKDVFISIGKLSKLKHFGATLEELTESQRIKSKLQFSLMEKEVIFHNIDKSNTRANRSDIGNKATNEKSETHSTESPGPSTTGQGGKPVPAVRKSIVGKI